MRRVRSIAVWLVLLTSKASFAGVESYLALIALLPLLGTVVSIIWTVDSGYNHAIDAEIKENFPTRQALMDAGKRADAEITRCHHELRKPGLSSHVKSYLKRRLVYWQRVKAKAEDCPYNLRCHEV